MSESDDALLELETLESAERRGAARAPREVTLTILAHPDVARVGARARLGHLARAGERVAVSRAEPAFGSGPLASPFVSRTPVTIEALAGGDLRLDATGCPSLVEVDGARVTGAVHIDAARLAGGVVVQLGTHVVLLVHDEPRDDDAPQAAGGLVGDSARLRVLRRTIARLGPQPENVLVRGETGSGKELVARALHDASARRAGPFVVVNMAAVPASLAASELFGHARGAFSGADKAHDGYFVRAHGGTLFLDEIADAPSEVQAALLRALETGEVQALGARGVQHVDVRVVAATDGDLERAVAEGRFRAPLYYRLATHELEVPPLRARRADIGRLVVRFLADALAPLGRAGLLSAAPTDATPWLAASLVARLARASWPGNVRQLRSVCLALAALSGDGRPLDPDDPAIVRLLAPGREQVAPVDAAPRPADSAAPTPEPSDTRAPKEIDADELEAVLAALDYRLGAAAERLGMSRSTMNLLVDRHPRLRRAHTLDADAIARAQAEAERRGEPAWKILRVSERSLQLRMKELGIA